MASLDVKVWTMSWDSQKTRRDFEYFIALDTLTKPQWEAAVRGWGASVVLVRRDYASPLP